MRPPLEVADIFRQCGNDFRLTHTLSPEQRRVMRAIERCRTAALGGHVEQCDTCGHQRISYNSCRNRHCPKCQSLAKARWLEARLADLLPVEYFHVVFTLPEQLVSVALQNKRVVYNLLFATAAETLRTIAADPRHLGAEIGFLAVLHTWGETLGHHPHLHCVIPGGGLSVDGERWISCRPGFFLSVNVLARLFRRLFLQGLERAYENDTLTFTGSLEYLAKSARFPTIACQPASTRVVDLRQASIRWARTSAGLPRPLYTSRGHLKPSVTVFESWQRYFQMARLPSR